MDLEHTNVFGVLTTYRCGIDAKEDQNPIIPVYTTVEFQKRTLSAKRTTKRFGVSTR